jgi:hypothetical protein
MKRVLSLVLVTVMLLGCIGLVACGGNDNDGTESTTQPASSKTTAAASKTTVSSSGGLTWNDMPVYSGAKQVQKGSWAIPSNDGDYSKVEWRYYEVGKSAADVISYYKSKMPDNGWTQTAWMEMGTMSYGMYTKNSEKDAAMIWVMEQDGKTILSMMRAAK